jgi:rhodanese-related sulfurtransferase
VAGNVADNVLAGRCRLVGTEEFVQLWEGRKDADICFVDTRLAANAVPLVEKYGDEWINIPEEELAARIDEIPRDKTVMLVCNTGLRSFESQLILDRLGLTNTKSVAGGMVAIHKIGGDI